MPEEQKQASGSMSFRGTMEWGEFWRVMLTAIGVLVVTGIVNTLLTPQALAEMGASNRMILLGVMGAANLIALWAILASIVKRIRGARRP